jgi:hypothetical protein
VGIAVDTVLLGLTGFFSQYSSFPCQYHSTNAPYSFIHLTPTLYNVFLPVLLFPCQYHSTNAPYSFIHLTPTLYNVFLPVLQFPCQYHSTNAPYSFIHLTPTLYNVFLPVLQFPCQYHSTNGPHPYTPTCCSYQKDKLTKPGNLPKKAKLFRKSGSIYRKVLSHLPYLKSSSEGESRATFRNVVILMF